MASVFTAVSSSNWIQSILLYICQLYHNELEQGAWCMGDHNEGMVLEKEKPAHAVSLAYTKSRKTVDTRYYHENKSKLLVKRNCFGHSVYNC